MKTLTTGDLHKVLLDVAGTAASEADSCTHPVDIAYAMSAAIEAAAETIAALRNHGHLEWVR